MERFEMTWIAWFMNGTKPICIKSNQNSKYCGRMASGREDAVPRLGILALLAHSAGYNHFHRCSVHQHLTMPWLPIIKIIYFVFFSDENVGPACPCGVWRWDAEDVGRNCCVGSIARTESADYRPLQALINLRSGPPAFGSGPWLWDRPKGAGRFYKFGTVRTGYGPDRQVTLPVEKDERWGWKFNQSDRRCCSGHYSLDIELAT